MSLWTKSDAAAGAPKFPGVAAVAGANGSQLFGNTQIAAFNTDLNQGVGIFGVDTTEQGVSATSNTHPQHSGWVLVKRGAGGIASITANAGSVGTNGYVTFSGGGTGDIAANVRLSVNTAGYYDAVTINTQSTLNGAGLYTVKPTAAPVSGNASFTITMGGRFGRRTVETLVATGTIGTAGTSDAADDSTFPDA